MNRCPTCQQPLPEPASRVRRCHDCQKPLRRHDKWCWVERGGVQTAAHRDCANPESYGGETAEPKAPLFEGAS